MDSSQMDKYMEQCIEIAASAARSGNYALGALVVVGDEVVARSQSRLISDDSDPSAHPEMVAVRSAARQRRSRYLEGGVLFSTLEPCPMCTSVAIWAKMDGVVFGASKDDAQEFAQRHPDPLFTWRQIDLSAKAIIDAGQPRLWLQGGVLAEECRNLFALPRANDLDRR